MAFKGQLSAEMVILLIVVIAVIAIVASNLLQGAKSASGTFVNKTNQIVGNVNKTCILDTDCPSGQHCVSGVCS